MWLDRTAPGHCQIGIDAFLAGVLGSVEQLTFLTVAGVCQPWVVLTVRGVDLHLEFPRRIRISAANLYLRAEPVRLTADPYGAGWLFEGSTAESSEPDVPLVSGSKAASWVSEEYRRLDDYLSRQQQPVTSGHDATAGPALAPTAPLEHLSREQMLSLFSEFFSTHEIGRR